MSAHSRGKINEMSRDESVALLAANRVGRIAFTFHDRVDIEPISYVYADGWLYARTSPGTKLSIVQHHPWVAFEIDEVHGQFDWRSVVVRGTIYFLDADKGDRKAYDAAVAILRSMDPHIMTDDDAAPSRRAVFRIHADEITGRRASKD